MNVCAEIPSSASLLGHRVRWTASISSSQAEARRLASRRFVSLRAPTTRFRDVEPVTGAFLLRVVEADVGSYEAVVDAT